MLCLSGSPVRAEGRESSRHTARARQELSALLYAETDIVLIVFIVFFL